MLPVDERPEGEGLGDVHGNRKLLARRVERLESFSTRRSGSPRLATVRPLAFSRAAAVSVAGLLLASHFFRHLPGVTIRKVIDALAKTAVSARAQLALKVGLAIAVIVGAVFYCRHFLAAPSGVALYSRAARCMLEGLPLQHCDPVFTYPPAFALVMIPFLALPPLVQDLIWYFMTIGALVACFKLSECLTRPLTRGGWSERDVAWLYGIAVILSLKFVFAAISNQAYDLFVVLLVLIGLRCLATRQDSSAGVSLALAAALKATPLLFLPYLMFKRRYLAAATMLAGVVILSLMPDLLFSRTGFRNSAGDYVMAWWHQVAGPALSEKMFDNAHTFWFAENPNNYSLRGLVGLFIPDVLTAVDTNPLFKPVIYAVCAVYLTLVAVMIVRTPRTNAGIAIDGSLLLISMLMLSPMTSQSHYIALVLPFAVAATFWLHGDAVMRIVAGSALAANLVLSNMSSDDLVGRRVTAWANEHRLLVIGALCLVAFFAVLVVRLPRSTATAPVPAERAA